MNNFENLTIVSITGHSDYTLGSMYAIQRSCMELPGAKGLLISPDRPENLPNNIHHEYCKPFGSIEYSVFTLYSLKEFIHTDYCLIVQHDGWVLNGKNWRDEFWQYDYIGSPFPFLYEHNGNQVTVHRADIWYQNEQNPNPILKEFQNGGFSLRSKRMLSAARDYGIEMRVMPPNHRNNNEPFKMGWEFDRSMHSEDILLSGIYRNMLENNGFKYADHLNATLFGTESLWVSTVRQIPITNSLGCHLGTQGQIIGTNHVQFNLTEQEQTNMEAQYPTGFRWSELFTQLGYQISYK